MLTGLRITPAGLFRVWTEYGPFCIRRTARELVVWQYSRFCPREAKQDASRKGERMTNEMTGTKASVLSPK